MNQVSDHIQRWVPLIIHFYLLAPVAFLVATRWQWLQKCKEHQEYSNGLLKLESSLQQAGTHLKRNSSATLSIDINGRCPSSFLASLMRQMNGSSPCKCLPGQCRLPQNDDDPDDLCEKRDEAQKIELNQRNEASRRGDAIQEHDAPQESDATQDNVESQISELSSENDKPRDSDANQKSASVLQKKGESEKIDAFQESKVLLPTIEEQIQIHQPPKPENQEPSLEERYQPSKGSDHISREEKQPTKDTEQDLEDSATRPNGSWTSPDAGADLSSKPEAVSETRSLAQECNVEQDLQENQTDDRRLATTEATTDLVKETYSTEQIGTVLDNTDMNEKTAEKAPALNEGLNQDPEWQKTSHALAKEPKTDVFKDELMPTRPEASKVYAKKVATTTESHNADGLRVQAPSSKVKSPLTNSEVETTQRLQVASKQTKEIPKGEIMSKPAVKAPGTEIQLPAEDELSKKSSFSAQMKTRVTPQEYQGASTVSSLFQREYQNCGTLVHDLGKHKESCRRCINCGQYTSNYKEHNKSCKKKKKGGKCDYCHQLASDFSEHKKTCRKWPRTCQFCKTGIAREEFDDHSGKCQKQKAVKTCSNCQEITTDINTHLGVCSKAPRVNCMWCQKEVNKAVLHTHHLKHECPVPKEQRK